jgi:hypothetical protein
MTVAASPVRDGNVRTRRFHIGFAALSVLGLALYVWPALTAPVVLWSDSRIDIAWAKAGLGILRPIPPPAPGIPIGHLPKPGYLLFLRLAINALPGLEETRSIVVVQSVLFALSILAASLWLARRRGAVSGIALATSCLLFLRLRDVASAVMSEALAAALMLLIAALLLEPARRRRVSAVLGLASGFLFLVRPNCGAAMLLLATASLGLAREGKRLLLFLAGFAALALPFWFIGRANLPGDPLHGLGFQIVEGSADYYWAPSVHPWPAGRTPAEAAREEIRVARENWKAALAAPEPDRSRQLVWRALHGLLGIEYYDPRWSPAYAAATTASRLLSPFLILGAIAILLAAPLRRGEPAKLAGLLLVALLIGQDVLLGSNPRYALPFLPAIFLFAIAGARELRDAAKKRRIALAVTFGTLLVFAAWQRHVLDWQWGRIESASVLLVQEIPRAALPSQAPATLHLRIAAPDPDSGAGWFLSASGRLIASGGKTRRDRTSPAIGVPIPEWLIEENRSQPVELSLLSVGIYGETSYLLFPVTPPPWASQARRPGSEQLSPETGVRWGALDWWAHPGLHEAPDELYRRR